MREHKKWTAVEVRQLVSMLEYGYSINRIARDLGRSPRAIVNKARSLKLKVVA